jgi:bifunctional enzyme CysN/CysC
MDNEKSLLRFTTTGSVDDGKSTLIGRLLYETNCIFEDQYLAVEKTSKNRGQERADLSLLLDGLAAEREQGITIDVAYRYFTTEKRKFIIADTPGHEQYTRNMVTGASTSQLAIILIDARKGVLTQSKRHGFLLSLLQIPHLIVCVNKMDLVDYSQEVYDKIVDDYTKFSEKLDIQDVTFIPVSALEGDNITTKSINTEWYEGETLLHRLENVSVSSDRNLVDFRFPVQNVIRPDLDFRGFAGKILSGTISEGEPVVVLPSGKKSKIKSIVTYDGNKPYASTPESVTLTLEDEIDVSRGCMIARENNLPIVSNEFDANICWMAEEGLDTSKVYLIKQCSRSEKAIIKNISYRIDVNTLHRDKVDSLSLNDIGRVQIKTTVPINFDSYKSNKGTGSFILIDRDSNLTVAAGMIKGPLNKFDGGSAKAESKKSSNVVWEGSSVSLGEWEKRNGHKGSIIWLTGLSGSGKSTIANKLVRSLFDIGLQVSSLDGDNVRHGLCGDLSFSDSDRVENIRRVGEVAKLFMNQGNITVCTFISPFKSDRDYVRSIVPEGRFIEVHVDCSLKTCESRDPKGLYKKAKSGEILNFTGISSPYEKPEDPEVHLETDFMGVDTCIGIILARLKAKGLL